MPNQPCYLLFTISDFLNLPENKFFDYFNHCTNVPVLPSHWQKGSTWISRSPILFPGSYPAYFKNVFFYRKSSSFECMKRKMMLDQKSAKFSRSAAETGGASFQPSSGYSSKLWVSPEWLTLGMMGGYKRNQYVLNICRTKNTVNSIIKCEE